MEVELVAGALVMRGAVFCQNVLTERGFKEELREQQFRAEFYTPEREISQRD